jgi:hypothetical protein
MGADLTINRLYEKNKETTGGLEASDEAVEKGYFRDCYNGGGLFAVLSLNLGKTISWWQMRQNKGWFSESKRDMTKKGMKAWLKEMTEIRDQFLAINNPYDTGEYDLDKHAYLNGKEMTIVERDEYRAWIKRLVRFIEIAIETEDTIHWSV